MENRKEKATCFISYSSRNVRYLEEFIRRLNIMQRAGAIEEIYSDRKLRPGEEWDKMLWDFLERSNIIIFLVSPDSLVSEFVNAEVKHALEKHERGEAFIFPVMLEQIDPAATPLGKFTISMPGGKPVLAWDNREEAWRLVAEELKTLINRITAGLALKLIEEAKLSHAPVLDLGNCGLKDMPSEILELVWLEGLILGNTRETARDEQLRFYTEAIDKESLWTEKWFTSNDGPVNDFEHCDFHGLTDLKNLRFLNIDGCVADLLKFDFTRFHNLQILLAGNNQEVRRFAANNISERAQGNTPLYSSTCPLRLLSLRRNNLQQLPAELFHAIAPTIQYLNLSLNPSLELSSLIPLGKCHKLIALDLEANNLRDLQVAIQVSGLEMFISPIENFVQLRWLNLNNAGLQGIQFLKPLRSLTTLYLDGNQLTDFSALANPEHLSLRNNNLSSLEAFRSLTTLKHLDVCSNQISDVEPLAALTQLQTLMLASNKIKTIDALAYLGHLQSLDASRNNIAVLQPLRSCVELLELDLRENEIDNLQEVTALLEALPNLTTVSLESNPVIGTDYTLQQLLKNPKGFRQLFRELEEKEHVHNNEVKLILVGNSTAGKSTLRRMLQGKGFADAEGTTHGIVRDEWMIHTGSASLKVHIWDFGGQEYYHETHKLFFSENAVYVLVWEKSTDSNEVAETAVNLKENGQVAIKNELIEHYSCDYWLKNLRHFAPKSTVLVVQNKIDKYLSPGTGAATNGGVPRIKRLPESLLNDHNILDSFDLSFKKVEEKDEDYLHDYNKFLYVLKKTLGQTAANFRLEANFYRIKEHILKHKSENQWTRTEFENCCKQIDPQVDLHKLIDYLCSISVILYFEDREDLKEHVIINPVWVSEQIYRVLDQTVLKNSGHFKAEHVETVLAENAGQFLALMKQFQIIFEDKALGHFVAPQYLPESNTNRYYHLAKEKLLRRRFVLEFPKFLPKTVMNNILSLYAGNAVDDSYYRYGIAFSTEYDTLNILEYDFKNNQIHFFSQEDDNYNIRQIFETILSLFDSIRISDATLTSMDKPTEDKLRDEKIKVLLSVDGETFVNWNQLFLQRAGLEETAVLVPERGTEIHAGAFSTYYLPKVELQKTGAETKKNQPVRVFISYSHKDELYKDELVEHLSGLRRQGFIQDWTDRAILPGDKWDDTIKKNLKEAQMILFLVSPSFLASDYIQDNEIKIAMDRSRKPKSGVTIVPIPVRRCDIENSALKDFQGGIKNFEPVSSWANRDDAWMDVINKLKMVIREKFRTA